MITNYDNPTEAGLMTMQEFWKNPACGNAVYENGAETCLPD